MRPFVTLVLFSSPVATCFEWATGGYYIAPSSLPSPGTSTCCGSDLVGNPALGTGGPTCLCDVTASQCDTGCCCDLDCSYNALKVGGFFGCTENGTVAARVGYTVCSDQVVTTNIPQHVQDSGLVSAFGGADGVLCIVSDNSPARGAFFRDPLPTASLSDAQISQEIDAALPIQFGTWLSHDALASGTVYAVGDPIQGRACVSASTSTGCASVGSVVIPALALDGSCSSKQQLPFLVDIPEFSCDLSATAATLADACGTVLNASFSHHVTFSRTPSAAANSAAFAFEIDLGNGTGYTSSSQAPPSSVYDAVTGTCSNSLLLYQLRLVVDSAGAIEGVTAYVRLGTLTASTWKQESLKYGAAFEYEDAGDQVRSTSGRPGYVRGLPLLIADGSAVRRDGLMVLPRSAMGTCGSGSTGATPIAFGEALAVTCKTQLSPSELEAFCVDVAPADQPLIAALNLTSATKVGVYGDSHPENPEDWVDLKISYPLGNAQDLRPQWDPEQQQCTNVLSGMNLRFLVAEVGAVANPIAKVVGAELILTRQTVKAARCALGAQCDTVLSVTATATFAKLDTESFEFIPVSPQIIPPLPSDFFYPFFIS